MSEYLEHFGTPCTAPEPKITGRCDACGDDIYDYEYTHCDACGATVHADCTIECANRKCTGSACKLCGIYNDEKMENFCCAECYEQDTEQAE